MLTGTKQPAEATPSPYGPWMAAWIGRRIRATDATCAGQLRGSVAAPRIRAEGRRALVGAG
jgi:hypothetical protein